MQIIQSTSTNTTESTESSKMAAANVNSMEQQQLNPFLDLDIDKLLNDEHPGDHSDYKVGSDFSTLASDDSTGGSDDSSLSSEFLEAEERRQEEKQGGLNMTVAMVEMLRLSTSDKDLPACVRDETMEKMRYKSSSSNGLMTQKEKNADALQTTNLDHENEEEAPKPKDVLDFLLSKNGLSTKVQSHESIADTFVKGDVTGYSVDLMAAVKKGDLDVVRSIYESGQQNLQCCNRFGESIVHAAARQGQVNILKFLVEQAGVSMRVCCDTGRTPLHDACWTGVPNFECIMYLVEKCPEFLMTADKRGFTPLDYVPKDTHFDWETFLNVKEELIVSLVKTSQDST